ncbi:MAG TPA: glycosyltransferase, partial [Verrucomicrobiota bacterium]|nr:glycosyltransferase [Verrucomicrobiota bacterium]
EPRPAMNPLVSVLVPNYNHERFLPQRMDSILAQTFRDYELIALDDCSTDNSREVLSRYAQKTRMRLQFNERNGGTPFKQWQLGASLASGKYLWIAESDDYADPRLLEVLVSRLESNPAVGLAYCQSYAVDEHNHVSGTWEHWTRPVDATRWRQDFVNRGPDEVARYLVQRNTVPNASAVVVKKDLLIRAVQGAERMRLAGDWWTWVRVLLESDVAFVAEPLNYFRSHGRSTRDTTKLATACAEEFSIQAYVCDHVKVDRALRKRVFQDTFYKWQKALEPADFRTQPGWLGRVHSDARRVHGSATVRMGWVLIKRALKRIGVVAAAVQAYRSLRSRRAG